MVVGSAIQSLKVVVPRGRVGSLRRPAPVYGVFVLMGAVPAGATPLDYGEGIKPIRWPANKTINIYIETDPVGTDPDTSVLLKEGMDRWASVMSPRGITINVTVGSIPNPAPANLVKCQYKANGTRLDADANDPMAPKLDNDNMGLAGCSGSANITGAQIIIRDDVWEKSATNSDGTPNGWTDDQRKENIRNLGQHEVTHVLGLGDDDAGTVTDHTQGNTPNTYNDQDTKEIGTLYPLPEEPESKAQGQTQQSIDPHRYEWDFFYNGAPDGHVPLIIMDIPAACISEVVPPPDWVVLDPSDPLVQEPDLHPFYQGYMEDGHGHPAPWLATATPALAFRALQPQAALSATHPQVHITVIAVNDARGPMEAWAGGDPQTLEGPTLVGPPVIPTLSHWGAVILSLSLLTAGKLLMKRR